MEEMLRDRIYLAGPWFTPEAMATQVWIEDLCERFGWGVFSPRKECLLNPKSSIVDQKRAFFMNIHGIKTCKLILANVEGLDTGTVWEMGAAFMANRPLVIYSRNPDRKLNVMLAQGSTGFIAGDEAIEKFLSPKMKPHFDWSVPQPWLKEVF